MSTSIRQPPRAATLASKKQAPLSMRSSCSLFLSPACLPYVLRYLSLSEANVLGQSCIEAERVFLNFQHFWA